MRPCLEPAPYTWLSRNSWLLTPPVGLLQRPLHGLWLRQDLARDPDNGLPRGFLVGAIEKVWLAHRLNWAGELLGRRGEELPRDVGSERRCLEKSTGGGLRRVRHAGDKLHQRNHQPLQGRASVSHPLGVGRATGRDGVYGHAGG